MGDTIDFSRPAAPYTFVALQPDGSTKPIETFREFVAANLHCTMMTPRDQWFIALTGRDHCLGGPAP